MMYSVQTCMLVDFDDDYNVGNFFFVSLVCLFITVILWFCLVRAVMLSLLYL